jgi:UDP-N-acetylmuramoyl-L-alanyl-D-glutamate--2,6-diaminopimelate ligase
MRISMERIRETLAARGLLTDVRGTLPSEATGISDDSRTIERGGLFIAVRGSTSDGHDFLDAAASRGASCAIVEDATRTRLPALVVKKGREAAALAAASAFQNPAQKLTLIGVTGTNGKTTTASILRHILDYGSSGTSASIGTLGVLIGSDGDVLPGGGGLTTPGPVELQRILRALVDTGVRAVAMEVSSHSLDQRRIDGIEFNAAVFTNFTRDHLDYHGTMKAYLAAKLRLLDYLGPNGSVIVNADASEWDSLPLPRAPLTFAIHKPADVRAEGVGFTPHGSKWRLVTARESAAVRLPLIGDVNVENALAAAAAAVAVGISIPTIVSRLATVPQVPGRLEIISTRPTVLRDYAHTPDALERALATSRAFTSGKLIVMFGCGGDRDRGKRPLMGEIAEKGADSVIVTSDNPRTEDPDRIIDEVVAGMHAARYERVTDRHAAIERAIQMAGDDDIVLLAGKGHETYQVRGTVSYPFDEKEIVREITRAHA